LNLPFGQGSGDPGEWAFDHRVGLCVTVIVYLVAGIVFMTSRIVIGGKQGVEAFYVDLVDERQMVARERQPMEGRELTDVSNLSSNEGAQQIGDEQLDSRIGDDRGTDARSIYDEAAAAQAGMAANREAYQAALRQIEQIAQNRSTVSDRGAMDGERKIRGNVTVSFSLVEPLRTSVDLHVPAYLCEGGGELVVAVTVGRNGEVRSASVVEASASVDDCMIRTAEDAARRSRFNIDGSAPERHQGTITYIFVPQ
jgi:hypothetical protein